MIDKYDVLNKADEVQHILPKGVRLQVILGQHEGATLYRIVLSHPRELYPAGVLETVSTEGAYEAIRALATLSSVIQQVFTLKEKEAAR